ncbi:MAG: hypothetical protein IEMM0008_0440 [bacterium]|nr:MAG: hypothetical protein IEMM0008_0440 [bacterium]
MKVLNETNEVILSREEYEALIEEIEDLEDAIEGYLAKKDGEFIPWKEARKKYLDV